MPHAREKESPLGYEAEVRRTHRQSLENIKKSMRVIIPKRCLSSNLDFATSRRDARQLLVGQDCIA